MEEDIRKETLRRVARELAVAGQKQEAPLSEEQIMALLEEKLMMVIPEVTEVRPQVLECDVVRFQNNKEKWVALVGLLDGYPYEIFTGLQDDEEGIMLPKTVTHGKIIKQVNPDGTKRYDFQFENKRGYKTTVEGLSEKFNPEYWNYAKLISGVLRYRMPLEHVIKLVASLSLKDESINTWKTGVERALKKYIPGNDDELKGEVD
jgi:ribonucleoside-diphosphate reductase alpha chain